VDYAAEKPPSTDPAFERKKVEDAHSSSIADGARWRERAGFAASGARAVACRRRKPRDFRGRFSKTRDFPGPV
jgi:hypothetical protein